MGPGFGAISIPEEIDDLAFGEHLHDNCGVLAVPGSCFGVPRTLRVSWLQAGDRLQEGLDILATEINTF